jgi:hypothetical protein
MKWGRVAAALLAFGFFLFPVMVKAQTVASAPLMPVIPEADVREVINKYIEQFKAMNYDGLIALFSKEAVENRMLPYNDLAAMYYKMFGETHQLTYDVTIDTIETYTNSAFAAGRYQLNQTLKNDGMRFYRGKIQWVLVPEDGSLKIVRLNYGNEMRND